MELKYKRILLKMSGEVLGDSNAAVSEENAKQAAKRIKLLKDAGAEVAVVVGGGNIMRGRSSHCIDRNRADHMGMLATAINSLAIQDALLGMGVDCTVLSAVEMQRFCDTYSSRQAKAELDGGKVVLFACGMGSPFFSTDTAAALRALEIHADALVLAKSVDAVYSDDPEKNPNAERYSYISYNDVIAKNLKATDITTITLCRDYKMPILLFSMEKEESYVKALMGENAGTIIGE